MVNKIIIPVKMEHENQMTNFKYNISDPKYDKLKDYYYQPGIHYTNTRAAWKLKQHFGKEYTMPELKYWLTRQPVYQIYQPKPKKINYAHYTISEPNNTHQIDILYLPHDTKRLPQDGSGTRKSVTYKYCLTVIDCASRYKAAMPLKRKTSEEVAKAIEHIYETTPLKFPKMIMSDFGSEFTGDFLKLMKKHNVEQSKSKDKKKVAFVERFNRTLAEKLFKVQYHEELVTGQRNAEWVDNLQPVIDELNNTKTRMIGGSTSGMKPVDAIQLEHVEQPEYEHETVPLSLDSIVRYLYKPGEAEGDKKYRATDPIWSTELYMIEEITDGITYKLQGIERTFTKEELMVVPMDTVGLDEYEIVE